MDSSVDQKIDIGHGKKCECYTCGFGKTLLKYTQKLMDIGFVYMPHACPSCGNRYHPDAVNNDKEICDTCFVAEIRQRRAFTLQDLPDQDDRKFDDWFFDHTVE